MAVVTKNSQMNIRINDNLKVAGDSALAEIGYAPSEAIRALWSIAARRGESLERVEALLNENTENVNASKRAEALRSSWNAIDNGLRSLGLENVHMNSEDDSELLEDALYHHAEERGWL